MKAQACLILAIAAIVLAVFPWGDFQGHTHWAKVGWIPFVSRPIRLRDMVANVLLFMPLGAAVAMNVSRGRRTVVASLGGVMLSFLAEWAQLYSHTRFPSATDLVCNTVGAAVAAFAMSRRLDAERPSR